MMTSKQRTLPFGPIQNKELFSHQWFENRLRLEPDWTEVAPAADAALSQLQALWSVQRERVELYGAEAPLEEAFIQPIFEILGWRIYYQAFIQGREPDYALFTSDEAYDEALRAGRHSQAFWEHARVVSDAKAWSVSLDRPQHIGTRREYPPEQIEWYLNRTHVDWGILTNGRLWRLVSTPYASWKSKIPDLSGSRLAIAARRSWRSWTNPNQDEPGVPEILFLLWSGSAH